MNAYDWLEVQQLGGCIYPNAEALPALRGMGVTLLVNLHEQPHDPVALAGCGLTELHLPVRDFTPPTPEQLAAGVEAIERELAEGGVVMVHCAAGLGRTGTLLACYLVRQGLDPDAAIERVRTTRPGSVETEAQVAAVHAFAARFPPATLES